MAEASSGRGTRARRPLSPHIQIYKWPPAMLMSILHRITGGALYVGTILLAVWLISAATGPENFDYVSSWFATIPGKLILFGYTWALIHHMLGGLRHFLWDTGRGYDLKLIDQLSWGTLVASIAITLLIWIGVGFGGA